MADTVVVVGNAQTTDVSALPYAVHEALVGSEISAGIVNEMISPETCGSGDIANIVYDVTAPFTLLVIDTWNAVMSGRLVICVVMPEIPLSIAELSTSYV